jgi:prepilin-type N-terminal cleavage/methylation domain-containing protein
MRKNRGFTIVEITITIVIIAILAAVAVVGYSKVQINARDNERSSKTSVIAGALERYYDKNGEYPGCTAMTQNGSIVGRDVLSNVAADVFLVPKAAAGVNNSITCTALTTGGTDQYAYVGDGSSTCATGTSCLQFTLQYKQEGTGNIISITSRHQTLIATSGTTAISAQVINYTQINLSWTAVPNAQSYKLQRATSSDFATGLVETNVNALLYSSTILTPGTTYYFRVAPIASSGQGSWSNTVSADTPIDPPPTAPTASAAMQGTNAVGTASGSSCPSGTLQYQLRYRSTATATNGSWSAWNSWANSNTYTVAALEGYQYGFQAQARCFGGTNGSAVSALSNIPTTVRSINAPAAPTYLSPASFNSNVNAIVNYASYCPSGTSLFNGYFNSKAWTGSSWGPNPFGFNDSWENYDGVNRNVEYRGYYYCKTNWTTSPLSAGSYNVIVVHPQ